MNDTGRMAFFLANERRRGDWADADEWRRTHRRGTGNGIFDHRVQGRRPPRRAQEIERERGVQFIRA